MWSGMLSKILSTFNKEYMKIRICQFNSITGDLEGNYNKMLASSIQAAKEGCDLIIFPQFFLSGYVLEDQASSRLFAEMLEGSIEKLLRDTKNLNIAIATTVPAIQNSENLLGIYRGQHLVKVGVNAFEICGAKLQFADEQCCASKIQPDLRIILKNIPFVINENKIVERTSSHLIYLNGIGGQDELIFDGESFIANAQGNIIAKMNSFEEDVLDLTVTKNSNQITLSTEREFQFKETDKIEKIYKALVLGLRDYMHKSGFAKAVLGLSGGIDSALVAAIAADAVGGENLRCVRLPSMFSSDHSLIDAQEIALALNSKLMTLPIASLYKNFTEALEECFHNCVPDVTEENLQARIRGVLLMSVSNKFKELLLNTGNKSEGSAGYATLYGDTCGGFSVLKDIYKTTVYKLGRWRNENWVTWFYGPKTAIIPENVFLKEPSAELRPGHKDSDSLPPYEVLDKVLKKLLEENKNLSEIINEGVDEQTIKRITKLLYAAEYKRRQEPPGIIVSKSYKKYPIANGFKVSCDALCSALR